jgi:hypothetical protein
LDENYSLDVRPRPPTSAFTPRTRFSRGRVFTVLGRGKNRICADVRCLRGRGSPRTYPASAWTWASARTQEKKKNKKKKQIFKKKNFLVNVVGLEREKLTIYNLRFSVFNPQNPQTPQTPRALRASQAKPREEEGFFSLVPLVTHPSSIPLLGGLTPKFLSLSLHSL